MKYKIFLGSLLFLLFWSATSQTNQDFSVNDKLKLDPKVHYGKLDNGFTYYIRHNESPANDIILHFLVKAGFDNEAEDQLEYAHLLEHIGASHTKSLPDVSKFFLSHGGISNAATTGGFTRYEVKIPTGDKEALDTALRFFHELTRDINTEQSLIDLQRGAVLGEMRTSSPHRFWMRQKIIGQLLKGTGEKIYDRPKHKRSIQNFNRDAFLRFYDHWYQPDLEAAVIVGNIDADSIETKIKTLFSDLKSSQNPENSIHYANKNRIHLSGVNTHTSIPDTVNENLRFFIVKKRLKSWSPPTINADFKKMILNQLYMDITIQRSNQLQQQYNPPYLHYYPDTYSAFIDPFSAEIMKVNCNKETSESLEETLKSAFVAWRQIHETFTTSELKIAKTRLLQKFSKEDFEKSENITRDYEKNFLANGAAPSPQAKYNLLVKLLEQIDIKDIQNLARENGSLDRDTNFIVFSGPEKDIPENSLIEEIISKVKKMNVDTLRIKREKVPSLEDVISLRASKDPVICQKENSIGVSTLELRNGIRLVLKPTSSRLESRRNTVFIDAFREGYLPIQNREDYLKVSVAPEVIQYCGAGPFDKFDLENFSSRKDFKLKFGTVKQNQFIHGEAKVANVDELLNLLYLYTTEPRKDPEAFKAWKVEKMHQLQNEERTSGFFYMDTLKSIWYPKIPVLKPQDLELFSLNGIYDAFQEYYSDFTNYTFIVTGDFDKAKILPGLIKKLDAFPTGDQRPRAKKFDHDFPLKKMNMIIEYPKIDHAYVSLYFPVVASTDVKTQAILQLLEEALGDHLWKPLRAGSYAPVIEGKWMDREKGIYAFHVQFDSALDNKENMIKTVREELFRFRKKGVDQQWLDQAISEEKKRFGKNLESYGYFNFWADHLLETMGTGEDPAEKVLKYETYLDHFISLKEVNAAAKRYIIDNDFQQFILIPQGAKERKRLDQTP